MATLLRKRRFPSTGMRTRKMIDLPTNARRGQTFKFGSLFLAMFLIGLMVMIGVSYLGSMNNKLTAGYTINQLEDEKDQLVSDLEVMNLLILERTSITHFEEEAQKRGMNHPSTEEIAYLEFGTVTASIPGS